MILVFGYNTPAVSEVPEVVYIGNSGQEAQTAIDAAKYPRLARLDHVTPRTVRHYAERGEGDIPKARFGDASSVEEKPEKPAKAKGGKSDPLA